MEVDDARGVNRARFLRSAQALALLFGAIVGAALGAQAGTELLTAVGVPTTGTVGQIVKTVFQFVPFAVVVALFLLAADDRKLVRVSVPDLRTLLLAGGSVVALLSLQYALLVSLSRFGLEPVTNSAIDPTTHAPAYFLAMVFVSILVVGPAEELLFRGAIQGLFRRAWGVWPAIVAAALLFSLVHYNVGVGTTAQQLLYVGITFPLGAILGYLYEYSENIVVPALTHGGYNAVLFGVQYLSLVGVLG